jgi:hypothetical protein
MLLCDSKLRICYVFKAALAKHCKWFRLTDAADTVSVGTGPRRKAAYV